MEEKNKRIKKDVDPERLKVLRAFPKSIIESLTQEEIKAFLYEDIWPDSLKEKLKEYLEDI